ncbi:conserved exported protein of unknown function [Rhodovastum atsumiense]|uniref:UrcA family protein n=1 Tax=Rhodovastum atsumiense TaxID=504468 RepID=A0A5M6IY64_9PROT|nr:hypothetical protein [Rhodovastum atsumiense]KAA5613221.1 hypothetical protein F1189_05870 [Rhodovastum atsumiense]CAH2600624.1 conserved exported protein of unknown function [Rhodovastum atsumiense]
MKVMIGHSTLLCRRLTAGVFLVGLAVTTQAESVAHDVEPTRVTTDSAAYCDELATQLASEDREGKDMPGEARVLATEGQRMCRDGLVRPGIYRLRRALQILHGDP